MAVEKLRSSYCSTPQKEDGTGAKDQVGNSGRAQLRGLDVVGVRRSSEISAGIDYADPLAVFRVAAVRTFAPGPMRPRRPVRRALLERFTPAQRARLQALDAAMKAACAVIRRERSPKPSERLAMAWQYTRVNPFTDYVDLTVRTSPALPTAAAVDRAGLVFEILFALKAEDEFAAYLVVARALGVRWKTICDIDPDRRTRCRLVVARDNALVRMLEIGAERGVSLI